MYSRKISSLFTALTLGVFQISIGANAQGYSQDSSYQLQQSGQSYSPEGASSGAFSQQLPQQMQNAYAPTYGQQQSAAVSQQQFQQQPGYPQQNGPYGSNQSQSYPPQYGQPVPAPQAGGYTAQQSQYPTQQSQYPTQQSQYPAQQAQYPSQQQYQQPSGQEPTYYGYATDAQGNANFQSQGQYGSYSNSPQAQQQPANLQDYLNQDQAGQQSSSENAQKSEGSGKGAALLSAGKALAGVAGTVATGYFLSKAAQKQAQNGGVPIMPNGYGYGGQYGGYGMPYGGGYGYGTPYGYGNGYGMPMGGVNPLGTSVMTGLNSLLGR